MHRIKCYNKDLPIENLEREMQEEVSTGNTFTDLQIQRIDKCRIEINKLKRERNKIDYFF
jgi:hypothetical protein